MKAENLFLVGAITVPMGFALLFGAFHYSSVCGQCGATRHSTDWHVPLTDITLFHHSSDDQTPLSRCLQTNGLVATHNHNWLFCHGAGNGCRCALGDGRHIESAAKS